MNRPSLEHLKRLFEKGKLQLKLSKFGKKKKKKDFIFLTVYVSDSLKPLMNKQLFLPHSTIIKTIKAKDTLILTFSRKIYIFIAIWVQAL